MPKPMYVWSGSAWVSVASEVESLAGFATQSYADNTPGTRLVVPSSVAVGSGSGSVGTSGTVTFSSASSVSLNGCFNSTYKNYRVVIRGSQSAQVGLAYRVRVAGTDLTSSTYQYSNIYNSTVNTTATIDSFSTATSIDLLGGGTFGSYHILEFSNPFEANRTIIQNNGTSVINTPHTYNVKGSALVNNTTSYDGFSLIPASGTMTGTIQVYGYKD